MTKVSLTIDIDVELLNQIDVLVTEGRFADRDQAIESAVAEHVFRIRRRALAEACAALEPAEERELAEEGLDADAAAWPPY